MVVRPQRGFTLIELLTVIAIIAVLAAILLPVFARVREQTKLTTCMSNLHQIYQAVNIYKTDNGEYPCILLSYAQRADGLPWQLGDPNPPVPASQVKHSPLFGSYIKDISMFHCPDNTDNDQQKTTTACYAPSSVWNALLISKTGHDYPLFGAGGYCFNYLPAAFQTKPIYFYAYDSYDISSYLMGDGTRMPDPASGQPGFEIVYSKDWTAAQFRGIDTRQDATNQLKFPNPPLDDTILTWCNYHVSTAHGEKCPVIFASGTAKPLDYKQMVQKGWNIAGHRVP